MDEEIDVELPSVGADDVAYIVYSSGTTGKPKGIKCPHRGAVHSYKFRFRAYPYEVDDVVACNVFFVWELFRPILKGIRMIVIPDDIIFDSDQLCHFLTKHKVTRMLFTPSLLETILDTQPDAILDQAFKKFRVLHLCGEVGFFTTLTLLLYRLIWIMILGCNCGTINSCNETLFPRKSCEPL